MSTTDTPTRKPKHDHSLTAKILSLFKQQREATNTELRLICAQYTRVISTLRHRGHIIENTRTGAAGSVYTYLGIQKLQGQPCKACSNSFVPDKYNSGKYCSHGCYIKNNPRRGSYSPVVPRILRTLSVDDSACWRSSLSGDGSGYTKVRFKGSMRMAHRVMYEALIGPIPAGLELDHKCRVRDCVNPEHLEPVTHAENVRRAGGTAKALEVLRNKTHCVKGHEYTPENTYRHGKNKSRSCRTCVLAHNRRYQLRIKAFGKSS